MQDWRYVASSVWVVGAIVACSQYYAGVSRLPIFETKLSYLKDYAIHVIQRNMYAL
jgi:hypothetical protein